MTKRKTEWTIRNYHIEDSYKGGEWQPLLGDHATKRKALEYLKWMLEDVEANWLDKGNRRFRIVRRTERVVYKQWEGKR